MDPTLGPIFTSMVGFTLTMMIGGVIFLNAVSQDEYDALRKREMGI